MILVQKIRNQLQVNILILRQTDIQKHKLAEDRHIRKHSCMVRVNYHYPVISLSYLPTLYHISICRNPYHMYWWESQTWPLNSFTSYSLTDLQQNMVHIQAAYLQPNSWFYREATVHFTWPARMVMKKLWNFLLMLEQTCTLKIMRYIPSYINTS